MPLLAESLHLPLTGAGQIVLGSALALAGCFLLLPKPRGRMAGSGAALLAAALVVFGAWLNQSFGNPMPDLVGTILFSLFSAGAIGFGIVLVVQRNPARGAIAFAFVILSTCGLFLLLAAPFLMAATIIVYAGAIVVTFLFVLMLSQTNGPSDENDRTREPLLGSLAGFAFIGLVLFTLLESQAPTVPGEPAGGLPARVVTSEEAKALRDIADRLRELERDGFYTRENHYAERVDLLIELERSLEDVVGVSNLKESGAIREGSIHDRLAGCRSDPQAAAVLTRLRSVRDRSAEVFRGAEDAISDRELATALKPRVGSLREELLLLAGAGELPARNVGNLGTVLYAEHLLAVELAGTLLLVATIGAIAISQRKGAAS